MKLMTVSDAQRCLPELVRQARKKTVGLTDEEGNLIGLLAGVSEDDIDDLLVQTPGFQALMAASRADLEAGRTVSLEDLMSETKERLAQEKRKKRSKD